MEAVFNMSIKAIGNRAQTLNNTREVTAARDALDLLRTFAFMHRENIRYDFLERCATGATKERALEEADAQGSSSETQSWSGYIFEQFLLMYSAPLRHSVSIVLPDVLRQARSSGCLDRSRIVRAMGYLRDYSLVFEHRKKDSWVWSMHPLVQTWAREIYEKHVGEQHVWCDAAATLISGCIVLGDDSKEAEELMRQLLPHVSEVKKRREELAKQIAANKKHRTKWIPILDSGVKTHLLLVYAKFSAVFFSAGKYKEAEELQAIVHQALEPIYGYESAKTRRITVALATTRRLLSRSDDQGRLLEKLRDNCLTIFGPDHKETHLASIELADARIQQGRVPTAAQLCKTAVPGLKRHCGLEDDRTLNGITIEARAMSLTGIPEMVQCAQDLFKHTAEVRERVLGRYNVKTLEARQNYYAGSFWSGRRADHKEAERGLEEIVFLLKQEMGREHPKALLAMLYLARVKIELREFEDAQKLFDYGLPIAERQYGANHMAILFCRYLMGRMYVRQGRWQDARDELVTVSERQQHTLQGWGRYHYDRIGTLVELARAYHGLGEYESCDKTVHEAFEGFKRISTTEHPWAKKLRVDWESWQLQRAATAATCTVTT